MSSHRNLRVAEAIREVVASAILFETADPRIRSVTVLGAEVSPDLRQATVYVSVMGSERSKTHPQGTEARRRLLPVQGRRSAPNPVHPVLRFKLDDTVKKSVEISRLIDEAIASDRKPGRCPEPVPRPRGSLRAPESVHETSPPNPEATIVVPTSPACSGTSEPRVPKISIRQINESVPWPHKASRSS